MSEITILLADDHNVLRQGIAQVLDAQSDLRVVAQADSGKQALQLARKHQPRVALLDIQMPDMDGIEVTSILRSEIPKMGIIILTMFKQDDYIFEAIKAGADGYLLKEVELDELLDAVRRVARGEAIIDPAIAGRVLSELRKPRLQNEEKSLPALAERDLQILSLLGKGLNNQEIADQIMISEKTVRNRLSMIFKRLDLKNRTEAALYARDQGLVDPENTP